VSVVTNVVLVYGLVSGGGDDEFEPLQAINLLNDRGNLVHVEDPRLPKCWFCNGKTLECNVAVGAFNYLHLEEWLDGMKGIDFSQWDCRFVQLLVMEQDDGCFRLVDVWQAPDA
jgi:hypothetical protein